MTRPVENIYERLERRKRVDISTGCWLWIGSGTRYGKIRYKGKDVSVHRLSAHLYLNFNLDSTLPILHKLICPNTLCFNPEHIYIGTYSDNQKDRYRKVS